MNKLETITIDLAEHYIESFPLEAARLLEQQNLLEVKEFTGGLLGKNIVPLFKYFNPHLAKELFESFPLEKGLEILVALPPEYAANILRLLVSSERQKYLSHLPKKISRTLHALVHHPSGTAGSLMDPNICEVAEDLSIGEVKKIIKNFPKKDFHFLYIVDREGSLKGQINFLEIFRIDSTHPLKRILNPPHSVISARANIYEILTHAGWQQYPEIPVVDEDNKLLGVLNYQILRSLQEKSQNVFISPLTTLMQLGETSWVGMIAAYQFFWGIFQEKSNEAKQWPP